MKQLIYGISFLFISIVGFAQSEITPEKALKSYINNGDKNFSWEVKDSGKLGNLKIYQVIYFLIFLLLLRGRIFISKLMFLFTFFT
jgi:hypothetical protein